MSFEAGYIDSYYGLVAGTQTMYSRDGSITYGDLIAYILAYKSSKNSKDCYAIRVLPGAEETSSGEFTSGNLRLQASVGEELGMAFLFSFERASTEGQGTFFYVYPSLNGELTVPIALKGTQQYVVDENGNKMLIEGTYNLKELCATLGSTPFPTKHIELVTAPNFSDEENPTITFAWPTDKTYLNAARAVISFDGTTDDIVRNIDLSSTSTSLTFNLTEEERTKLRLAVTSGTSKQVVFRIFSEAKSPYTSCYSIELNKTLTLVGAYPQATLEVEDIDPNTLALTGDKNTIVKYYSDAAYVLNATASKGAVIASEEVTCADKVSTTETGVLENVESGDFTFLAIDNRNNAVSGILTKNFVDYIKLTCQQKIDIDLTGAEGTGAAATVKISGNYFRGSFGLTDNSLVVQIRHTQNDGSMGDWVTLTDFVEVYYGNGTYSLEFGVSGLDYAQPYTFQCRAIDKLATAQTAEYTTRVMPVFDWSGEDFSFNVPVNINADTLDMANSTVLRHTGTNTVLSANDGHIYIRPSGTNSTSNETIFYNNGDIKFGGTVDLGDSFTIGGYELDDFVVESGEEAMGSNGTWYWRKWKSGVAECWGSRNFGNMAISTAFGSLYRSAIFSQSLPSGLFKTTPEVINIQMNNGGNGCWIAKWNDVVASAVTSGSFIVINATSGNITPSQIGFNIKGFWY